MLLILEVKIKPVTFNVSRTNVIRWCQSAGSVLIKNKRINRETRRVNKLSDEARQKSARNQECEKKLYEWFVEQRNQNIGVGTLSIRNKMNSILQELKPINPVKPTNSWLQRFNNRYNLTLRRISGSGRSFPSNLQEIIQKYFDEMRDILRQNQYKDSEIFNFDESCFRLDSPSLTTISHIGARKTYSRTTSHEKAK